MIVGEKMSIKNYTDDQLKEELQRRNDKREKLAIMPRDQRLAYALHDKLCRLTKNLSLEQLMAIGENP
jgi:hypothetical protein